MRHSTNEISHAKGGFHQNCFQLNATPSRAVPRCPGSAASLWSAAKFQRKKRQATHGRMAWIQESTRMHILCNTFSDPHLFLHQFPDIYSMCALNREIQSAGCCNVRLVGLQTFEVDESHQWWMDTASAVQNGGKFVTKCRQLPDIAQGGNLKRPPRKKTQNTLLATKHIPTLSACLSRSFRWDMSCHMFVSSLEGIGGLIGWYQSLIFTTGEHLKSGWSTGTTDLVWNHGQP